MTADLNGDFENVKYSVGQSILLYDNNENEEYPLHWHNAAEIIMPLTNGFEVICSGKSYPMSERDVLIIPAGTLHNLKARRGRRIILLCDNKVLSDNPALTNLVSLFTEPLLINSDYGKEFRDSINRIIEDIYTLYFNNSDINDIYIYIKLLTLLAHIKEYRQTETGFINGGKYADTFGRVIKYIDRNYMNDITLEELAKFAGYSTYHFSRMFKKYSGTAFVEHLNRRRVIAAQLLLSEADAPITEIAMRAGFSSITTFNRVFKKINGCTPSEYKKLYSGIKRLL